MSRMKIVACGVAAALALGGILTVTFAAQQEGEGADPMAGMPPEFMAEMQAMMEKQMPNEHHRNLQKLVGTWKVEGNYFMGPGMPPMPSTGTSTFTSLLGGRYVQENFETASMGDSFQGIGITGYDNVAEEYQTSWVDSMSTMIMVMTGKPAADGSIGEMTCRYADPGGAEAMHTMRFTHEWRGDDTHIAKMYDKKGDDPENLLMELTYTRQKATR